MWDTPSVDHHRVIVAVPQPACFWFLLTLTWRLISLMARMFLTGYPALDILCNEIRLG